MQASASQRRDGAGPAGGVEWGTVVALIEVMT